MDRLEALPIADIRTRGSIRDQDVALLRQCIMIEGRSGSDLAETLLALHRTCPVQGPAWAPFLIDAICNHIIDDVAPEGYLTAANTEWLLAAIQPQGRIDTKAELDLLLMALDRARWAPVTLVRTALEQVCRAVETGAGPLRATSPMPAGAIAETEVELVRRILYAFGADGRVAITRDEAEVLFAINDAVAAGGPNPAWTDLFVKAIANVVMSASGYEIPSREAALAPSSVAVDVTEAPSATAYMLSALTSRYGDVIERYVEQTPEERALARLERQRIEIITGSGMSGQEADWLSERLGRDGVVSLAEAALVGYLRRASRRMHPALADKVAQLALRTA